MKAKCEGRLTMTVAEYVAQSGIPEHSVRQDLAAGKIPHRRSSGSRGLIRILRIPALRQLGATVEGDE